MKDVSFTDIHSHFLFDVDDGAENIKKSLEMLEQAASLNIRHLLATPHVTELINKKTSQRILNNFSQLKEKVLAEKIPVKISLASELFYSRHIYDWLDRPWSTFNNNKKYLLFELPLFDFPDRVGDFIFQCRLNGLVPILAHPERYIYLRKALDKIFTWYNQGCLMQMNAGSLTGQFGSKAADFTKKLLEAKVLHFAASDAHDLEYRSYDSINESYNMVKETASTEYADELFIINPGKAISGEPIFQEQLDENKISNNWLNKFFINFKKFRRGI
jgi:protein-tyrosine phosphatase